MTDSDKNPHDDHIEDLLSQLQGIFGKLSKQEEEPAAAPPPKPAPVSPAALQKPPEAPPPQGDIIPQPPALADPTPTAEPAPEPTPLPVVAAPLAPAPTSDDPSQLATHIAYPLGREAEAKSLAQKLETITPKFTKVAFHLKVTHTAAYDPKSEWKESVIHSAMSGRARALFTIMDRPLDETRRKAIMVDMEKSGVYFQEVPLLSIEKKAFYTDVLLGLVFFMDSQKPGEPGQAA